MDRGQLIEMVLTGGRTGQTVLLNKHPFVKGVCKVYAYPESFTAFLTVMGRSYNAFPRGSAALAAAQERDRASGILDHLQKDSASVDRASAAVQGAGGTASGEVPSSRALHGEVDVGGSPRSEGLVPRGPGYEDAGVGEGMESDPQRESAALMFAIEAAVKKLDPTAPEQWTEDGFPSVDYIAQAVSNQTVTREMISAAVPGFDRRSAEDLATQF